MGNRLYKQSLAAVIGLLFTAIGAFAGEPTEQLRQTIDSLLTVLKGPDFKDEAKAKERRQKLREIGLSKV